MTNEARCVLLEWEVITISDGIDGLEVLENAVEDEKYVKADEIAYELTVALNRWHSSNEKFDDALDSQIHKWYVRPPKVFPKNPFFRPSSANADPRELYEKLIGTKGDNGGQPAHQGRWTRIGTSIGDIIQRDILFMEKHMDGMRFKFERTETGEPMFEEFAKKNLPVRYRGKSFYLCGSPDGIMQYTDKDGSIIRVGLEIKSKQTTYAKTGDFSMKDAEESHKEQCKVYSMMYDLDYYVVLYVNASKKSWYMSEEDVAKYPDIRAFGLHITREDKLAVLDRFVDVLEMVERREPPLPDMSRWTFNNYKQTIAKALTDEEVAEIGRKVDEVKSSKLPKMTVNKYVEGYESLLKIRGGN